MTTVDVTQRQRLERAFETLKNQGITPILVLTGSTGVIEEDLADYTNLALAAGTPQSWVGAHAGSEETTYGAHWVDGGLSHCATGHPVPQLWFSFPRGRGDIADALLDAFEQQAFYASWLSYNADGEVIGVGTDADCVRLVLKEED